MDFKQIEPTVKNYLNRLKEHLYLQEVLLFGSFAKAKAREDSDVDLLIVSSDFKKMDDDERLRFLYRKSVGFPYDLHVYGVTPQEYKNASPLTTLGQIKKEAKAILP